MFGVIDDTLPVRLQIGHGLFDHPEVILEGGLQNVRDMQCPGFTENRADRGARIEQGADIGIVLGPPFSPAGGTEGCEAGILPRQVTGALEEFNVLWIRARPATFDERHTQIIKPLRDPELVICRKGEAFRLGTVAQGRVVDLYLHVRRAASLPVGLLRRPQFLPQNLGDNRVHPPRSKGRFY